MGKLTQLKELKKAYLQQMFPQGGERAPRLRFTGFNEPWEERKLSEVARLTVGGGTPRTDIKEFWNGDIPWFQS
ncbi:MAG: hypothetical protein LBE35_03195 [Clostridiales bacterium]|jgi:type I restriction enzyme S subunit|nr:hypothetical protein [Clostridiales bacterium]